MGLPPSGILPNPVPESVFEGLLFLLGQGSFLTVQNMDTPWRLQGGIKVNYSPVTAEWQITGKRAVYDHDIAAYTTYNSCSSCSSVLPESCAM